MKRKPNRKTMSNIFNSLSDIKGAEMTEQDRVRASQYQKQYKKKLIMRKPWMKFLLSARGRCKNKSHRYTQRGIECSLTEKELYKIWKRDKPWLLNKPSLDRINGRLNYSSDNCRFVELSENISRRDVHNTPQERVHLRKPVGQYKTTGELVKKWGSITQASKETSINDCNISACVAGRRKITGGFIWKRV